MSSPLRRHRQLAPASGVRVSPLCLGAMTFGGRAPERYGECPKEAAFGVLDTFYKNGGTFIDTANGYQEGQSEVWVGEWIAARNVRDDIFLATKYTTLYTGHEKNKIQSNYVGNNLKSMRTSIEASLKKLQTTYIDLFYVHWWDYTTSIPELMHGLNDLVTSGKVNYLGISDTPAWIVSKANQYARDHGLRQFVVYQGMWNAGMRDFERDIIPMARDEGMALAPYGVLGQGRFQTEEKFKEREQTKEGRQFGAATLEHDKKISKVLEKIAKARDVPITSVALAYVIEKTPYVFPIVGARKVEHIQGSIDALALSLSDEEIGEIEAAYEFDHGFPHTFLSGTLFQGGQPRPAQQPGDVWLLKHGGEFDWVELPKAINKKA